MRDPLRFAQHLLALLQRRHSLAQFPRCFEHLLLLVPKFLFSCLTVHYFICQFPALFQRLKVASAQRFVDAAQLQEYQKADSGQQWQCACSKQQGL